MLSRELFEIREKLGQPHVHDFLTVGSMGHASQIALGISMQKPNTPVACLDGDGAFLMHMGSAAIVGANASRNFKHIIFNNGAHDSVGGQPTVAGGINLPAIALACNYREALSVDDLGHLEEILPKYSTSPEAKFVGN